MTAPTELTLRGTADTVVSSGSSSSISNNAAALSGAYTPTSTGYTLYQFMFNFTYGTNPTAGTAINIWLLLEDGSNNYETGSTSGPVLPARNPDMVFPVIVSTSAQASSRIVLAPPGPCKALVYNNGTGQTISSGWSLLCIPFTYEAPTQ